MSYFQPISQIIRFLIIYETAGPCSLFEIYEPISDSCISALNVTSAPNTWQDVSLWIHNQNTYKATASLAPIKNWNM